MNYTDQDKKDLLNLIGKNINYYRYHANNTKIMNEKGFVTIERLAEEVDSSPNMFILLLLKRAYT